MVKEGGDAINGGVGSCHPTGSATNGKSCNGWGGNVGVGIERKWYSTTTHLGDTERGTTPTMISTGTGEGAFSRGERGPRVGVEMRCYTLWGPGNRMGGVVYFELTIQGVISWGEFHPDFKWRILFEGVGYKNPGLGHPELVLWWGGVKTEPRGAG
eukprot:750406-Hanusia_phi.AAC.1